MRIGDSARSADRLVTPIQVWAYVPHDLQQRTIRLIAQLAMHLVVAQVTSQVVEHPDQEVVYAVPSGVIQDSARSS